MITVVLKTEVIGRSRNQMGNKLVINMVFGKVDWIDG